MEQAEAEDDQEFDISGYSDDLLLCLAQEKKSVEEMLNHLDKLATAFQSHVEELRRKEKGSAAEETEEEEKFEDAKENGSINSNTSKTQRAAEDSQAGTATSAVPRPQAGEGGHHVPAAVLGMATDSLCG